MSDEIKADNRVWWEGSSYISVSEDQIVTICDGSTGRSLPLADFVHNVFLKSQAVPLVWDFDLADPDKLLGWVVPTEKLVDFFVERVADRSFVQLGASVSLALEGQQSNLVSLSVSPVEGSPIEKTVELLSHYDLLVLQALVDSGLDSFALHKKISQYAGVSIYVGTMYRTLKTLMSRELVERVGSEEESDRTVYQLTHLGVHALESIDKDAKCFTR